MMRKLLTAVPAVIVIPGINAGNGRTRGPLLGLARGGLEANAINQIKSRGLIASDTCEHDIQKRFWIRIIVEMRSDKAEHWAA